MRRLPVDSIISAVRRSWKLNRKARIYQRCSATSFAQFICTVHLSRAWRIAPAVSVASYWHSHDGSTGAVRSTIKLSFALLDNFGNIFAVTEELANIVGELYAKAEACSSRKVRLEKIQVATNIQGLDEDSLLDGIFPAVPSVDKSLSLFNAITPNSR